MSSRPVFFFITLAGLGAAGYFLSHRPHGATAGPAPSPAAVTKTPRREESAARRDPEILTPEKQAAASRLANQVLACLHDLRDRHQTFVQLPEDLTLALPQLDASQHRLVMNALIGDASLAATTRAMMGNQISFYWLQAHGLEDRAACASALATLGPLVDTFHDGVGPLLASMSLDFVAQREPDLAARWFTDHLAVYDSPNQTPDANGYRARLLASMGMAGQPATSLAQIEILAPKDQALRYATVAREGLTWGGAEKTAAAFQSAEQAVGDPATAALIHQSYLAGLSQGISHAPPESVIPWFDAGHLSAADQQTVLDQLELPPFAASLTPWLTWLDGKLPAETIQEKLTTPAAKGATQSPSEAVQWITALPEGPAREAAIHAFACSVGDSGSADAAQLATTLPEGHPDRPALLHPTGGARTDFLGNRLRK